MKIYLRYYWILAFLFIGLLPSLKAQFSTKDSSSIDHFFSKIKYYTKHNLDTAIIYCDSVITLANRIGWTEKKVEGLLAKTELFFYKGAMDQVKENLEQVTNIISNADHKAGNKFRQLEVKRKILSANYYNGIGKQRKGIGMLTMLINELEDLPFYDKQDSTDLRNSYVVAGAYFNKKGNYEKALAYYFKARQWFSRKNAYSYYISKLYLAKKDYKKAEKSYRIYFASKEMETESGDENVMLSSAYCDFANLFLQIKEPDNALHYLQEAKKNASDHSYPNIFYLEGKAHLAKDDYPRAFRYFKLALNHKKNSLKADKSFQYAKYYQGIGEVYAKQKDYEKALAFYQKALINLVPDFDNSDYHYNPKLNNPNSYKELLEVFGEKINALYALEQKEPALYQEITITTTDAAIDLIDSIRLDYFGEEDKQFLLAQSYPIYEKAIAVAFEKGNWEYAFYLSEKSKAVLLYEAVKIKRAKAYARLDDNLLLRELEIKNTLIKYRQELQEAREKSDREKWYTEIYDLKQKHTRLLEEMKKNPQFQTALNKMTIVSSEHIRDSILSSGQTMLEFFDGEDNIYAFLISKENALVVKKVLQKADLKTAILEINEAINKHKDTAYAAYAHLIYDRLLSPFFPNELPQRLVIVPDGILGYIPFPALLLQKVENVKAFRKHPYLGRQVCLSQWFSASFFVETQSSETKRSWEKELLAYAPSFRPVKSGMQNLLFELTRNDEEVKDIRIQIGSGTVVIGEEAIKNHFLQHGLNVRILHFATHSIVDIIHPLQSFIAFSNIRDTSDQFFKLGLNELYHIDLTAEMVVLSACETGLGKLVKGEGAMSIARGFTYAGVRSVITTLWNINDKSTNQIMNTFYASLKAGERKDQALQTATNQYLEQTLTNDQAHPRKWAALTAIGNMEPMYDKKCKGKWFLFLLMLVLGFAYFYFKAKKRESGR